MFRIIFYVIVFCAISPIRAIASEAKTGEAKPVLAHPVPSLSEARDGKDLNYLNLDDSIKLAVQTATVVKKSEGDNEITGAQLIQGYAQFLPNLVATANYGRAQGSSYLTTAAPTYVDTNNHGGGYQVLATLNIFNGFSDIAGLRSAIARREATDLNLKRAKQLIALDVAQSFLQVILDQEIVKIAEKNLLSSQDRERLLEEQTKVGVRNLADLFRQQAQTSSDETFLSNSQNKERGDTLLLLRKLRLDANQNYKMTPPEFEAKLNPTLLTRLESTQTDVLFGDERALVETAIGNRTDLKASDDIVKAARSDVTQAKAGYFPKLDFGLGLSAAGRILDRQTVNGGDVVPASQPELGSQLGKERSFSIGLTLTWSIFDRWMTVTNVERAAVNASNARLDYEDRQNQIVAEIRQAYGDYRGVQQQLESTKKGYLAAQKAFEVMQGRYQVGSATFVDLSTSQAALVQAEASRAQAVIAFALQTRTMQTALGTIATQ